MKIKQDTVKQPCLSKKLIFNACAIIIVTPISGQIWDLNPGPAFTHSCGCYC